MSNQELIDKYTERNQKIKQYIDNKVQPSTSTEGYDLTILRVQTRIYSITFNESPTLPTGPVQLSFDHSDADYHTISFDQNRIGLYYNTIYNNGNFSNDFSNYGWKWTKSNRTLTFNPVERLPDNNSAKLISISGNPSILINIGTFKGSLVDPTYANKLEIGVATGAFIETNGDNTLEIPLADYGNKPLNDLTELLTGDLFSAGTNFVFEGKPSTFNQLTFRDETLKNNMTIVLQDENLYARRFEGGSYITTYIIRDGLPVLEFDDDYMSFDGANTFKFKHDLVFQNLYPNNYESYFTLTSVVDYVDKGLIDPRSNSIAISDGKIEVKNPIPDGSNTNNYDVLCVNNGTPVWETMMGVVNFGDLNFYYDEEQGASFSLANFKAYLNYFNPNIPLIEIGEFEWWTELPDGFEFSVHKPEDFMDGTIPASYLLHWPIEGDLTFDLDGGDRPHPSTRQYKFSYRIKMAEPGMVQMDIKCLQDIPAGTNFGNGKFRVDSCSFVQDRS